MTREILVSTVTYTVLKDLPYTPSFVVQCREWSLAKKLQSIQRATLCPEIYGGKKEKKNSTSKIAATSKHPEVSDHDLNIKLID